MTIHCLLAKFLEFNRHYQFHIEFYFDLKLYLNPQFHYFVSNLEVALRLAHAGTKGCSTQGTRSVEPLIQDHRFVIKLDQIIKLIESIHLARRFLHSSLVGSRWQINSKFDLQKCF
jgi:hypothetical protein